MTVNELCKIAEYSNIELHNGFDGKKVATSSSSIKKFGEARVLSVHPEIKVNKYSPYFAQAFLYVYVDARDVAQIKREEK